jgi:Protein of unknown function (DUF2924)
MRGHSTNPAAVEAEIAHLRSLALDALRRHWRLIFGRTPPADLSKDLLGRMIAWRLQELATQEDRECRIQADSMSVEPRATRRRSNALPVGARTADNLFWRHHVSPTVILS